MLHSGAEPLDALPKLDGLLQRCSEHTRNEKGGSRMADGRVGGISVGGILVIVGIVLAILLGHWWIGLIIALVGLVFFGGFAKGKWY
jgi:hypothetical protein